ncbi:carbon-nitrogen hydrolase family protein [Paenibacillus hodogayensis]|uniref:Carbon-nitrogen hydrolase family protein n=1 Tax=Paenibacillus hodogayensis TaxID=279208 RepID=A0ABV5VUP8_9BACL
MKPTSLMWILTEKYYISMKRLIEKWGGDDPVIVLNKFDFAKESDAWVIPESDRVVRQENGLSVRASGGPSIEIEGPGVHTRNGDAIHLVFKDLGSGSGYVRFGFDGGFEYAYVECNLDCREAALFTSEWNRAQPVVRVALPPAVQDENEVTLVKTEGAGNRIKLADLAIYWNGECVIRSVDHDIIPQLGVRISVEDADVELRRFAHEGPTALMKEYLKTGAWQMLNSRDVNDNVRSICKGIRSAAELGIELLVAPEYCIFGFFRTKPTLDQVEPMQEAEAIIRACLRETANSPYLIVGRPNWDQVRPGSSEPVFNSCRLYDPDGNTVRDNLKFRTCERYYYHGHMLNEFDIYGVPVSLHVCHDRRYPDLRTLPVMFGARLIIHPVNGGLVTGARVAVQAVAKDETATTHAFYLRAATDGGSYVIGPKKFDNLLAISSECKLTDSPGELAGAPAEELVVATIRTHDAFGYWPVRAYRASEAIAEAYEQLYRTMGGQNS